MIELRIKRKVAQKVAQNWHKKWQRIFSHKEKFYKACENVEILVEKAKIWLKCASFVPSDMASDLRLCQLTIFSFLKVLKINI